MADDIGGPGEDPRDVARRRLNVGRRVREAEAQRRANMSSGPALRPQGQSVVPYEERLPADRGGRDMVPSGGRDVVPSAGGGGRGVLPPGGGDIVPSGGAGGGGGSAAGRSLVPDNRIPINPRTPPSVGSALFRRALGPAGVVADLLDSTPVADATLRGSGIQPYGGSGRFNDEVPTAELPPTVVTAEADRELQSRAQRRNTQRPATRMSPRQREMTADELNAISLGVITPGSGATSEPGREGDIARRIAARQKEVSEMKKGGKVKRMAKGGVVKASGACRADGIAARGKTRGRMV